MIDQLTREHEVLRAEAADLEAAIGPCYGTGWDDCGVCDVGSLRAAEEKFINDLLRHEKQEKEMLASMFSRRPGESENLAQEVDRARATLDHLLGVLKTLSVLCDGSHVYAVRSAVQRVREELDEYLRYEEKVLFARLRGGARN